MVFIPLLTAGWCIVGALLADATSLRRAQEVAKEVLEETLLGELGSFSSRLATLQVELAPTFNALPKNQAGHLDPPAVRYGLHRYFVQKHGWYIKGLDPEGDGRRSFSSAKILADLAPAYLQEIMARRLGRGLKLEELAILAATLADLIHSEGMSNLLGVYEALRLPVHGHVTDKEFDLALRAYLAVTIIGFDAQQDVRRTSVRRLEAEARERYPQYDDVLMWAKDTRLSRNFVDSFQKNPFAEVPGVSFNQADAFMLELFQKFGSLVDAQCGETKEQLVRMEFPGTGRVPLSAFYANGALQLRESVDYLRSSGALDEVEGRQPMLVIPNYLVSPSHCMPFSDYFLVCCADACEGKLGSLELAIGAPSATPERITEVMSELRGNWSLSESLLSRLSEIAGQHRGRVPLHSRLFAQWMHHVYPRECPYPHVAGSIRPVTQDEWIAAHSSIDTVLASEPERLRHMTMQLPGEIGPDTLPWTCDEEELLLVTASPRADGKEAVRAAMAVVAALCFGLPLVSMSAKLLRRQSGDKVHVV